MKGGDYAQSQYSGSRTSPVERTYWQGGQDKAALRVKRPAKDSIEGRLVAC